MSFDFVYAKDRYYPQFEVGDEVFTNKDTWKAISANKPYVVVSCHKKPGMSIDIWVITLVTDFGYKSEYATYHFNKTQGQLREDKINSIID